MTAVSKPSLELGRVSKAHGVLGELRVDLHWSGSSVLERVAHVQLGADDQAPSYVVERARAVPKGYLLKLGGVDDRDAAERLRGMPVRVPRELLPALAPGEYYLVDLIGASVAGPEGPVGRVARVVTHPTVDALVIELADGRSVELPLIPNFVERVDAEHKQVVVSSLDGLL